MRDKLLIALFFSLLFLVGCNPFPKKDTHPEVPFLADLVKDQSKFRKISDMNNSSEIIFLKNDRILLKPYNSNLPFKITDIDNRVILQSKYDWKLPFYIDSKGDLYFNREKYFYPDYTKKQEFKNVVFQDSLNQKLADLENLSDSVKSEKVDQYEIELLKPYGLKPCEYSIVNTERCDIFEVRNGALIVRQTELFKIEFLKPNEEIKKFDDDVLIAWRNGRVATPVYLAYYQLNNLRFKCDDMTYPKIVTIAGKKYIYLPGSALYQFL